MSLPPRDADLAERIASELHALMREGDIDAGAHLSSEAIAQRFAVSRTPVRRALALLAGRGLARREPRRGYFATPHARLAARDVPASAAASDAPPAYYRLAADWLHDRVPVVITEQAVCDRYDVRRAQARLLLARAAAEGWAEPKAGYGWQLLPVAKGREAALNIHRFRLIVEPAGLLEPGFRASREQLAALATRLEMLLERDIATWPADRLHRQGVAFHEALAAMSGNSVLLGALCRANRQRALLEYASMAQRARHYDETREHLAIVRVLERDEREEAARMLREHLAASARRKGLDSTARG